MSHLQSRLIGFLAATLNGSTPNVRMADRLINHIIHSQICALSASDMIEFCAKEMDEFIAPHAFCIKVEAPRGGIMLERTQDGEDEFTVQAEVTTYAAADIKF